MAPLPQTLRSLTPDRARDDVRLRAVALWLGLIPPRTMHSREDVEVLLGATANARRVVEIGVYEGASAIELIETLSPDAELHLIDPFGAHADALPGGWGASERATRRAVARAQQRRGAQAPSVRWHIATSHAVAARWSQEVDTVLVDGDHSHAGCEQDWKDWHRFVAVGGHMVFHDARSGRAGGRGLPGPTAVVDDRFRGAGTPDWEIAAEADRAVAVRRIA